MKTSISLIIILIPLFISLQAIDENSRILFSSIAIINCALTQSYITKKTQSENE